MAENSTYSQPVTKLMSLGKLSDAEFVQPRDYIQQFGLTAEHVAELARLMSDTTLWQLSEKQASSWSVIHAMRALTQIRTDEAIRALLDFAELPTEGTWVEEWLWEELPEAFGQIGAKALPTLEQSLQKPSAPHLTLLECVQQIAETDPDTEPACVNIILKCLANAKTNEPDVNGFLIAALMDLAVAKDHLKLIEEVFVTAKVDTSIAGDWDDVQVALGLKEADPNKVRASPFSGLFQDTLLSDSNIDNRPVQIINRPKADKKEKKKRKDAKKARKKNRKK
jgi:hypothetical protein